MSYITVFALFYIPFSFKLVRKRKKRRIEEINKLQKKTHLQFTGICFSKYHQHSNLKMLSFKKTDLYGYIPVNS